MSYVRSMFGTLLGRILVPKPYWACRRADGKYLTELDMVRDATTQQMRPFDWVLDLYATGDRSTITELWMFAPPTPQHLQGESVFLHVKEPGCYFQFKVATIHGLGGDGKQFESMVIGRVDDKETGECTCFVWDAQLQAIGLWHSNVYSMGSWRDGIAPLGAMEHTMIGINLR